MTSFTASTPAVAAQVNTNFSNIRTYVNSYGLFTDVASQTVTKTLTFNPDSGAAITVTTGGITITAGGLTVTAGNIVATAGNVTLTAGNLTFGAASAKIIPGATSLLFRDNADANTNLSITDAGVVTARAGVTVTAGGLTVSAGGLTVSSGTAAFGAVTCTSLTSTSLTASTSLKLVSGSSNIVIRDNGDSRNAMVYDEAGRTFVFGTTSNSSTVDVGISAAAATNNTRGFFQISVSPGNPTGTPAANLGAPIVWNSSNLTLHVYDIGTTTWRTIATT
jgi:hypothetical protein